MKKIALLLIVFLAVQLCGCVSIPFDSGISDVKTLTSWSFQYNEGTDDYSVFFGLLTESQKYVSADVNVDVRIVNDNNEEVYKGTHSVDKDDFNYYKSQVSGEEYLANLRIPADRIKKGTSVNGKVYEDAMVYAVIRNEGGRVKTYKENIYEPKDNRQLIASKTDKAKYYLGELNGRSAKQVYMDLTGARTDKDIIEQTFQNPLGKMVGKDVCICSKCTYGLC